MKKLLLNIWKSITFVWIWIWKELRDWKTIAIFGFVVAVIGIEVWLPILLGIILNNQWLIGIGVVCETFWLMPFTPFIPICIAITAFIKSILRKCK